MKKQWKGFISGILVTLLLVGVIGTAAATSGKRTVELTYRDIKVTLDGEAVELVDANNNPVEPFMIAGTNYLPVHAVAQTFGLNVGWDGKTHTILLTTPQESKAVYITRTGSRWHNDPNCNGGTYWEVPYSTAVGMGLTPCDKCVHD